MEIVELYNDFIAIGFSVGFARFMIASIFSGAAFTGLVIPALCLFSCFRRKKNKDKDGN